MLFSNEEKNKLRHFYNVANNLELVIAKVEEYYPSTNGERLEFNFSGFEYKNFTEDFRYLFNYLEHFFASKISILTDEQIEHFKKKIGEYDYILGHTLEEANKNNISKQFFVFTIISSTLSFFNDIKNLGSIFEVFFNDDNIDVFLKGHIEHLINVKEHFKNLQFGGVEDINDFYNNYNSLNNKLNDITKKYMTLENEFRSSMDSFFSTKGRDFDKNVDGVLLNFNKKVIEVQVLYENELKGKVSELIDKFDNNKYELDSLLGDVKLYKDKMTNKAVSEMSAHYYKKSKFERNSYFAVTIASAIIIIFSVVSAYWGVNGYYNQYVSTEACDKNEVDAIQGTIIPPVKLKSYQECMKDLATKHEATQKYAFNYLIFRLSFSLLLFLAVIYASRIAMRAYNHWRQSENMYLKLNTLSPFIGSLDKSVRNDVHLSLVPDYFGKDAGMVENSKEAVKDLPTNISNIAIKAIEQAGSTIGSKLGSDKETKNSDSESSTEKNKKKSVDDPE